jgi:hypothetical protein
VVELQVDDTEMMDVLVGNLFDPPDAGRYERWLRGEADLDLGDVASGRVLDGQFANDRNGVLVKCEVDALGGRTGGLHTTFQHLYPSVCPSVSWGAAWKKQPMVHRSRSFLGGLVGEAASMVHSAR